MPASRPVRIEVLGVPVDRVTMGSAVRYADYWLDNGDRALTIFAVNPEKVIRARTDSKVLQILQGAGLLIPDGIGVVLAARWLGLGGMRRVAGADLMPELCRLAARKGRGVFLYGAKPEVNERAAVVLRQHFPALIIVGRQDGYLPEEEMPLLIQRINSSHADILFVALGSPRQELWMETYLPYLNVRICQGIGGTLDVLAGAAPRAPELCRRLGLEWLYRLLSDPKRAKRQLALPEFACLVIREGIAKRMRRT